MAELNEKQLTFCKEYIIDFNASAAARRAGYSEKTAGAIAFKLLKKAEIQAKIQEEISNRAERTEITADRVLQEYAKIAFSSIKDVVTWSDGGGYVKLRPEAEVDGALIAEISNTESGVKVKMHDRMRALEALAKHTGFYDERPQTTINITPYKEALEKSVQSVDVWDGFNNEGPEGEPDVEE